MKQKYNILVTGCGGDIGQSIGKILKSHPMFNRVIGCDISDEHAGKFIFDETLKISNCRDATYLPLLETIIKKHQIDLILPISEPELRFITEKQIQHSFLNKPLICANLKAMEIGFDKFATAEFLKFSGLPYPETFIVGEMRNAKLPLILKRRTGSGSKSIFLLKGINDFNFYKNRYPEFIAQEFLNNENEEYTCGLFRSKKNEVRTIIYKRKLVDSYSGYGVLAANGSIDALLVKIAIKLDLIGSINIQLRITDKGPCVFEINPRFSSTVKFRHMMGFEDVIWSVQDVLEIPISPYIESPTGTKFYKGFHEYIN